MKRDRPSSKTKRFPDSRNVVLRPHDKTTTSCAFDPSGTRLATGSMDHSIRLYNFSAMSSTLASYRNFEPDPGHIITSVDWNARGSKIAISCGSSTAHIYTRDAKKVISCVKGDPYINDMMQTKGHVGVITRLCWHPTEQNTFLTSSIDGSVRVWHLDGEQTFGNLICNQVLKARNVQRGTRVGVSSVTYSPNNGQTQLIAATCEDGSLQVWRAKETSYGRPDFTVPLAHLTPLSTNGGSFNAGVKRQQERNQGGEGSISIKATSGDRPTFVCFSPDGLAIATRGGRSDNTVKLWDVRMLGASSSTSKGGPLKIFSNIKSNGNTASNMSFGEPGDGSLILVASSCTNDAKKEASSSSTTSSTSSTSSSTSSSSSSSSSPPTSSGELLYFRCKTSKTKPKHRTILPNCCPINVQWQKSTQQIAVGCTDGTCRIFFDEEMSTKGAMMLSSSSLTGDKIKKLKPKKSTGYVRIDPHANNMNADEMHRIASQAAKRRKVDEESRIGRGPELPNQSLKDASKSTGKKSFTQMVMKHRIKNTIVNTDPREALLKYAKIDPLVGGTNWIGEAYSKSDPNRVLAKQTLEQEEEDEVAKKD